MLIAQWLAQLGVQHILLLARSARTTSAASQHLCQLWQGQAQAMVSACDAGCAEDVSATLAPSTHHQHLPPLCAVLHAGGVLADATLRNQTLSGLRKVMGAKVSGLPHLLGAAQLQPGAHHVLFSSVASLLGSPGQANYSAANAALDAAASSWQHTGLPTVSVQWGAWAGGGMAANDASTAARVARLGMSLIQPQQGLQALQQAMACSPHTSPITAAVPFIWPTFLQRQLKGDASLSGFYLDMAAEHAIQPASGGSAAEMRSQGTHAARKNAAETYDAVQAKVGGKDYRHLAVVSD
jgi:hypothetical protein